MGGARYSQPLDPTNAKKFELLASLGEFFVVGFSQNIRLRWFREFANFYLLPELPIPVLRYGMMFTIGPLLGLWLVWRHKVRLLVAQSPYEGFAAACAKIMAGWLGRRVGLVIESHNDFEETVFLQRKVRLSGLYRLLMRHVALFSLKRADVLRGVSKSTRQQLHDWAPGKKVLQFVAWTDIDVFMRTEREPGYDSDMTILFVGVLIPRKGVHVLMESFVAIAKEFPTACLLIIGDSVNGAYRRRLERQRALSAVPERIIFRSSLSQTELARYMAQARALVLPSSSEALGRVVLEGMACRTPVIGSAVGGIPDMIEDGVTGFLVPPGDVGALAERLRWILENPKGGRKIGEQARASVQRLFSPEAYVASYQQLCESAERIMEGRGASH